MANLIEQLGQFVSARATPRGTGLSASEEAEQRRELAKALVNLAEAESSITVSQKQLGMEGLESWSNVQTSLANAQANLVEAVASHSRAQAMDRASTAELLKGILAGPENVRATEAVYGKLTPEETKSAFNDALGTNLTAARNGMTDLGSIPVVTAESTADGLPVLSGDYEQAITNYMIEMSREVNTQLGDLGGAAKVEHLNDAVSRTMNGVAILLQEAEEAAGAESGSFTNPDMMSLYARKLQNEGMGDIVNDSDRAEYEGLVQAASASLALTNARVEEYLGGGVTGVSSQLKRANDALARVEERLGGSPFEYLESLPAAKMPEGIGEAKKLLRAELARLDAPDPMSAAVAEMRASTPGFVQMRQALGFRSDEALAMYFRRNPDFYLNVMRSVRSNPEVVREIGDLNDVSGMTELLNQAGAPSPRKVAKAARRDVRSTERARQAEGFVPRPELPQADAGLPDGDQTEAQDRATEGPGAEGSEASPDIGGENFQSSENSSPVQGASLMSPVQPDLRFARFRRQKMSESAKQIQSDLQKRLSRILTPPTGDDTPPIKTA